MYLDMANHSEMSGIHLMKVQQREQVAYAKNCEVILPKFFLSTRKVAKNENGKVFKEYQKNLVVIDYPGRNPCDVTPLREYDKLFDGSIRFSSNMDEEDIREEIARILRDKASCTHDLSGIKMNDFIFVRCANKKVRVPDGDSPFDSKGICQTYTHGAIYVRLNKPMWKGKVYVYVNYNILCLQSPRYFLVDFRYKKLNFQI